MRRGFTLVEVMVATVIALVLVAIMVQIFGWVSKEASTAKHAIETENEVRHAAQLLETDLGNITAPAKPSLHPEREQGYLEIIEGEDNDVLLFTARSLGEPYFGRHQGQRAESQEAEVAWFVRDGMFYRRVLLILPDLILGDDAEKHYELNDISARFEGRMVANSLGDLTKRENRFAHGVDFPHLYDASVVVSEVVVADKVTGFDVKVYDPGAPQILKAQDREELTAQLNFGENGDYPLSSDFTEGEVSYGWTEKQGTFYDLTTFMVFQEATFAVEVPPDNYFVRIRMGDSNKNRDNMRVMIESKEYGRFSTGLNEVTEQTFDVAAVDGRIDIRFTDLDSLDPPAGGTSPWMSVRSIEVLPKWYNVDVATEPPPETYSRKIDFGTADSPIASGYDRGVKGDWQAPFDVDRVGDALTRDAVVFQGGTFTAQVPIDGIFDVTLTLGDAGVARQGMQVTIQGQDFGTYNTDPSTGAFKDVQARVRVAGQLTINVKDDGIGAGSTLWASVAALAFSGRASAPDVQEVPPVLPPSVRAPEGIVLTPSDPGYVNALSDTINDAPKHTIVGYGDFADLNYLGTLTGLRKWQEDNGHETAPSTLFHWGGNPYSQVQNTWDTWSTHYERDGKNQDGDEEVDEYGEAPPPYPDPLRGIQVTIRVEDPASQQIREVTVVQDFSP